MDDNVEVADERVRFMYVADPLHPEHVVTLGWLVCKDGSLLATYASNKVYGKRERNTLHVASDDAGTGVTLIEETREVRVFDHFSKRVAHKIVEGRLQKRHKTFHLMRGPEQKQTEVILRYFAGTHSGAGDVPGSVQRVVERATKSHQARKQIEAQRMSEYPPAPGPS
jgi:hypothetical protein